MKRAACSTLLTSKEAVFYWKVNFTKFRRNKYEKRYFRTVICGVVWGKPFNIRFDWWNWEYEILIKFYKKTIVEDLTKEELLNHKNKVSYSCLGTLSKSELDNFLENLYS